MVSHRFNSRDLDRFPGGEIAGEDARDDDQEGRRDGDAQVDRRVAEDADLGDHVAVLGGRRALGDSHSVADQFRQADAQDHSDVAEEGRHEDRFRDDEREDRRGLRADRLADAEFFRPFLDGDEHDVADADNTGRQRPDANDPDEKGDAVHHGVEEAELIAHVPEADRVLVGRVKLVAAGHPRAETGFEGVAFLLRGDALEREGERAEAIAVIVELLGYREGNVSGGVIAFIVVFIDADDLEHQVPATDVFPQRIRLAEKDFGHAGAEDDHLAAVADVDRVDEAAMARGDVHIINMGVVGKDSFGLAREVFVVVGEGIGMRDGRRAVFDLAEVPFQVVEVCLAEGDTPFGGQALPRLRGVACRDAHHVGRQVAEVVHDAVMQPIARAEEDDEHEDAPRDREPRQERPQLIPSDRAPDLTEVIEIKHVPPPSLFSQSSRLSGG